MIHAKHLNRTAYESYSIHAQASAWVESHAYPQIKIMHALELKKDEIPDIGFTIVTIPTEVLNMGRTAATTFYDEVEKIAGGAGFEAHPIVDNNQSAHIVAVHFRWPIRPYKVGDVVSIRIPGGPYSTDMFLAVEIKTITYEIGGAETGRDHRTYTGRDTEPSHGVYRFKIEHVRGLITHVEEGID